MGIIALAGLDAENGVLMLLYLDVAYEERKNKNQMRTVKDLSGFNAFSYHPMPITR